MTTVPQEKQVELEESIKELMQTIADYEAAAQVQREAVDELQLTVNDKQLNIQALTRQLNEL